MLLLRMQWLITCTGQLYSIDMEDKNIEVITDDIVTNECCIGWILSFTHGV